MKPRNKHETRIVELSKKLGFKLEKEKQDWAYSKFKYYFGVSNRYMHYCLECGYTWKGRSIEESIKKNSETCACCKKKLTYTPYYSKTIFTTYVSVFEGVQVIRVFENRKVMGNRYAARFSSSEVIRHFITDKGRRTTLMNLINYHGDWKWGSGLEVRSSSFSNAWKQDTDHVYPKIKVLPIYKKYGFKNSFHGLTPVLCLDMLLYDNSFESLFKNKLFSFAAYYMYNDYGSKHIKYKQVIKLANRHNYKLKANQVGDWYDLLSLLEYFKKDLMCPKYSLPINLKEEHDRLVAKKEKIMDEERRIRNIEIKAKQVREEKEKNAKFIKRMKAFKGFVLEKGDVKIVPLTTPKSIERVGNYFGNCVFTNAYHHEDDNILFTAMVKGKKEVLVQFSINRKVVTQARDKNNEEPEINKTIEKLINNKVPKFLNQIQSI